MIWLSYGLFVFYLCMIGGMAHLCDVALREMREENPAVDLMKPLICGFFALLSITWFVSIPLLAYLAKDEDNGPRGGRRRRRTRRGLKKLVGKFAPAGVKDRHGD